MTGPPVLKRPPAIRPPIRHRRPVREPKRFAEPIISIGMLALILQMYWMQEHWGRVARRDDRICIARGGMGRRYDQDGEAQPCERCEGRRIAQRHEYYTWSWLCSIN